MTGVDSAGDSATSRDSALAEIAELARTHGLGAEEICAALELPPAAPSRGPNIIGRVLGYLGGVFVFAGLCVFVGTLWGEMNSAARIIATLGSGVAALVLFLLTHVQPRHRRLGPPLFLMAVVLQPTGLLVTFAEFSSGGEPMLAGLITAVVMAVQCGLIFQRFRGTMQLACTLAFATATLLTGLELLGVDENINGLVVGLSLFFVTRAVDSTRHRGITPLSYFAAAALIQLSWYQLVEYSLLELSFVGVACALVYASTAFKSKTLLASGTAGLLFYIGDFTSEHFADSIGWPLALILLGIVMMGLSTAAMRIHRRYIREDA